MQKEFKLSDKIEEVEDRKGFEYQVIPFEDVKEFIRLLKEEKDFEKIYSEFPFEMDTYNDELRVQKAMQYILDMIQKKIDKLIGDLK